MYFWLILAPIFYTPIILSYTIIFLQKNHTITKKEVCLFLANFAICLFVPVNTVGLP